MRERKEVDTVSPRWSAIGGTPKTEKIHRVPPMNIGGQFIQPIVSLNRTLLNTSIPSKLYGFDGFIWQKLIQVSFLHFY